MIPLAIVITVSALVHLESSLLCDMFWTYSMCYIPRYNAILYIHIKAYCMLMLQLVLFVLLNCLHKLCTHHIIQDVFKLELDFSYFYTRNLYVRIRDCWNRPIASAPGPCMDVLDRYSDDYNLTFK